jgi:hypothetical protein
MSIKQPCSVQPADQSTTMNAVPPHSFVRL